MVMFSIRLKWLFSSLWWWVVTMVYASDVTVDLSPSDFYQRVVSGDYDALVDVRTRGEWNQGHIEGATLVESLATYTTAAATTTTTSAARTTTGSPTDLAGCEYCDIIVYCRSGARAAQAITILRDNGFRGRLANGKGVMQWQNAGYPLVNTTESVEPPCTRNSTVSGACYNQYMALSSNSSTAENGSATPRRCQGRTTYNGNESAITDCPDEEDGQEENKKATRAPASSSAAANARGVGGLSWWILGASILGFLYRACMPRTMAPTYSYGRLPPHQE